MPSLYPTMLSKFVSTEKSSIKHMNTIARYTIAPQFMNSLHVFSKAT